MINFKFQILNFKFLKYWPGLLISLIFLTVGIATLSDYGLNEDSPFHFLRGQAYLHLFTTGNSTFIQPKLPSPVLFVPGQQISLYKLNASESPLAPTITINQSSVQTIFSKYLTDFGRHSFYEHQSWNGNYYFDKDSGHPPLSDILTAATNKIFYQTLNLLGDIESYHLFALICAGLTIFLVFYFTSVIWDQKTATIAAVLLATFPFFFAESHYNIKDIPETALFTGSVISFYFWVSQNRLRWLVLFIFSTSFALSTKFNIVFAPFIVLPWLFVIRKSPTFKTWFTPKLIPKVLIAIVSIGLILVLSWPFLWTDIFPKLLQTVNFYTQTGAVDLRIQTAQPFTFLGLNFLAPLLVITTTPPFILFGLIVYVYLYLTKHFKQPHYVHILLLAWLFIPILRILRPGAGIYNSTRQFMEYLPALVIISSVGLTYIIRKLPKYLSWALAIGYLLFAICILNSYHPFQQTYFNFLAGGPIGATQLNLSDWQTPYDTQYRQTINWLNSHAEFGAKLAFLDGTMTAIPPIWLRNDIRIGSYFSGFSQSGEYIMSVVYPHPPVVFPYLYLERFLTPVYEIKIKDQVIAKVWRNSPEYSKIKISDFKNVTVPTPEFAKDTHLGLYWQVDFDQPLKLIHISLSIPNKDCLVRAGLFELESYFVPQKTITDTTVEFDFPAETTSKIRYYPLLSNTCFEKPIIKNLIVIPE